MKCPYCKNEMQQGYVQCRDGLRWTEKRQPVAALSFLGRGAIPIGMPDGVNPNSTAIAYPCEACKMVIIPYGDQDPLD